MSGASPIKAKLRSVKILCSKPPAPVSSLSKIDSGVRNCHRGANFPFATDSEHCIENEEADNVPEDDIVAKLPDDDIVTKLPIFRNKCEVIDKLRNTETSSDDSQAEYSDNSGPSLNDISATSEEAEVDTFNQPFNSVVRKHKYLESILNSDCASTTNPSESHSNEKIYRRKNKTKSKCAGVKTGGNVENEERFQKYPKMDLLKLMELLLDDKDYNPSVIAWVDASKGKFKITNSTEFAMLRGRGKNGKFMEFTHVNRSIRYHTKRRVRLLKVKDENLTYQFKHKMNKSLGNLGPANINL